MPKSNRGGRRSTATTTQTTTQTTASTPRVYTTLTNQEAQTLRDQQDSMYNGTVTAAVKMYISGQPHTQAANVDGQGHSMSQTMNYLLENGEDLNNLSVNQVNKKYGLSLDPRTWASIQYMNNVLNQGSHDLGHDVTLTKYGHQDILKNEFGISNYSKLSEAQLQSKLVGGTFTSKAYMSTSYDPSKSPFNSASGSGIGGGREVIFRINAKSDTKVLLGAKAQSEIIINKGTNYKITNVQYTGNIATPRLSGSVRQIVIDLEVI